VTPRQRQQSQAQIDHARSPFLESLRIQVDQESFDQDPDKKPVARLSMTRKTSVFLKSLRIATDDSE